MRDLLYIGDDRTSQGRVVLAPRDGASFACAHRGGFVCPERARYRAATCADVPRERMGDSVCRGDGRGEDRTERTAFAISRYRSNDRERKSDVYSRCSDALDGSLLVPGARKT